MARFDFKGQLLYFGKVCYYCVCELIVNLMLGY